MLTWLNVETLERWNVRTWIGFCGITLFYILENIALRYTTAINAGVLANFRYSTL